jgi:hypothetical protein
VLSKCTSVAELVNQVVVIGSTKHFYKLDDVNVADFAENSDLVISELTELWGMLKLIHIHHLHCVELLVFSILSLVDITILSLADLLEQHVVFDYLVHLIYIKNTSRNSF